MPAGGGEPQWFSTAFFALIILSFIPGPWQIITGPIISVINTFYMFKFGLFFLGIAAVFGLQWWVDFTTAEGQCPQCSFPQRGSKSEPFQCPMCGEQLEYKDEVFVMYKKSGKVPGSTFEQFGDFVKEAAKAAPQAPPTTNAAGSEAVTGSSRAKKGATEVVDAEVL